MNSRNAVNIEDLRRSALRRLPHFVSGYLERGAGDSAGVARNIDAFRRHAFVPRAFVDVSTVRTETEILGRSYSSAFGISAIGTAGVYRRDADAMLAEAAVEANIPFMLSGASTAPIEQIARISPRHVWFQLYAAKTAELTDRIIGRAHDAGVGVLVYTVDYPIPPRSEVVARTGVSLTQGPSWRAAPRLFIDALSHPAWTLEFLRHGGMPILQSWAPFSPRPQSATAVSRFFAEHCIASQHWRDLDRIRRQWPGSIVVKGVVDGDDVIRAVGAGADAVAVSNHGGNKLDCMESTLDALVAVRDRVGSDIRLLFDGGIRRGSDILVAKALGADFCFVGRATFYGVVADGRRGAARAIEILQADLNYTMAMIGQPDLSGLSKLCLTQRGT